MLEETSPAYTLSTQWVGNKIRCPYITDSRLQYITMFYTVQSLRDGLLRLKE